MHVVFLTVRSRTGPWKWNTTTLAIARCLFGCVNTLLCLPWPGKKITNAFCTRLDSKRLIRRTQHERIKIQPKQKFTLSRLSRAGEYVYWAGCLLSAARARVIRRLLLTSTWRQLIGNERVIRTSNIPFSRHCRRGCSDSAKRSSMTRLWAHRWPCLVCSSGAGHPWARHPAAPAWSRR